MRGYYLIIALALAALALYLLIRHAPDGKRIPVYTYNYEL